MSTLAAVCVEERALQEEYKAALQAWTEARSAYPIRIVSPKILKATRHLDAVELNLKNHRRSIEKPLIAFRKVRPCFQLGRNIG
jgi:hypothetical protein